MTIAAPAIELTLERSHDIALIKRIATDPHIWPHISDDGSPPPESWQPPDPDICAYIVVRDGGELLGNFESDIIFGANWIGPMNQAPLDCLTGDGIAEGSGPGGGGGGGTPTNKIF